MTRRYEYSKLSYLIPVDESDGKIVLKPVVTSVNGCCVFSMFREDEDGNSVGATDGIIEG